MTRFVSTFDLVNLRTQHAMLVYMLCHLCPQDQQHTDYSPARHGYIVRCPCIGTECLP